MLLIISNAWYQNISRWLWNDMETNSRIPKYWPSIGRQKDKPKGVVRWNPTLKKVNRNNASNMAKGNFVLPYDWIFFNQLETHCTFGSLLLRGLLKVKYSQNVCLTTPTGYLTLNCVLWIGSDRLKCVSKFFFESSFGILR